MTSTLLEKPILGPLQVSLRDYQQAAIDATRAEFGRKIDGRPLESTYLVMATGTGKTVVFGMIARLVLAKGGRVLILVHQNELVHQAVNKLDLLGVEAAIEKAGKHARATWQPDCVVATIQTLKEKRLNTWPRNYFNLIITDEVHHATADSYRLIYSYFQARRMGVTATPDRTDGALLRDVFQSRAFEYSMLDAMTAPEPGPYLCRLEMVRRDSEVDLTALRKTKADYNMEELASRITPHIDTISNVIREESEDRLSLHFMPDVPSSQALATALHSLGLQADWVSGDDPDRDLKIARFRRGDLRHLVNCQLATEGFDVPNIAFLGLVRPTKSDLVMAQMVGRGTRLKDDGGKCRVLHFHFQTDKPGLVSPLCVFDAERFDDDVLTEAERILGPLGGPNKVVDLLEVVQEAERIEQERKVLSIQARERKVGGRRIVYDPLAVHETLGIPWRGPKLHNATIRPASERQIAFLKKLGVEDADKLSKTRAHTMIDFLVNRMNHGLASVKQVGCLIGNGTDPTTARALTFAEAHAAIDELQRTRWRRA